jgi:hypothetical protein
MAHFFCDPGFRNAFVPPEERFITLMDGPTIFDDEMFSHAWMRRWSFAMWLLCFTALPFGTAAAGGKTWWHD